MGGGAQCTVCGTAQKKKRGDLRDEKVTFNLNIHKKIRGGSEHNKGRGEAMFRCDGVCEKNLKKKGTIAGCCVWAFKEKESLQPKTICFTQEGAKKEHAERPPQHNPSNQQKQKHYRTAIRRTHKKTKRRGPVGGSLGGFWEGEYGGIGNTQVVGPKDGVRETKNQRKRLVGGCKGRGGLRSKKAQE